MDPRAAAESVFREESGRIIATLIRLSGSFDLAEEAMQDALASALESWPQTGIPRNPAAWITAAAQRKLIDATRRETTRRNKQGALAYESASHTPPPVLPETGMTYPDDRLRLIFTCCHPALSLEAQVALTLRTLGGLETSEIARAFLTPEPTMAQRLVRAKRKIQTARIPYEVPPLDRISDRLTAVQSALYLIFNEGYSSTSGARLIRTDLCREAIRLASLLCTLLPAESENWGLLALMLLHHSRHVARVSNDGALVVLEEQDRACWDQADIQAGIAALQKGLALRLPGPYQIQAAIAAVHAEAASPEQTDWPQIAGLYARLRQLNPTPVVALNYAVAIAFAHSLERGLTLVDQLESDLKGYRLWHAARADLLRRLQRLPEAAAAYRRALEITTNEVERNYLQRRFQEVTTGIAL